MNTTQAPVPPANENANTASATESPIELIELMENLTAVVVEDEERSLHDSKIKLCRVMIVDDEEANVLTVKQHLVRAGYQNFVTTTDARQAITLAHKEKPDLILLDIKMPHINGLEILHVLGHDEQLKNIPVVILTAAADPKIKATALEMGANDFLTKPVDSIELIPRVRNALLIKTHFDQLANQKMMLQKTVKRRTQELYKSRQQIILSLARAAEHRDNDTGNHVIRVGVFAAIIAKQLGWTPDAVEMIQQAAQLHDVGKIGIPDEILFKAGKLDPDEYDLMKHHCVLGKNIISPFDSAESIAMRAHVSLGQSILHVRDSPLMMMAARIAQTHHEHWDGKGYPLGLAKTDIPIEGRITAVADVFDALSSDRPYKEAFPREKCFEIMEEMKGSKFDPAVLEAFFACSEQIIEAQIALVDEPA